MRAKNDGHTTFKKSGQKRDIHQLSESEFLRAYVKTFFP
jgi:hypothetical protein